MKKKYIIIISIVFLILLVAFFYPKQRNIITSIGPSETDDSIMSAEESKCFGITREIAAGVVSLAPQSICYGILHSKKCYNFKRGAPFGPIPIACD